MKKFVYIFISILILLSFVSCSKQNNSNQADCEYDVDLTALSSTMVYAEVYNMLYTPDDYLGKTVKMEGAFSIYEDPDSGKLYFAILISDATACCSQGIEFELSDTQLVYPDDYPEPGDTASVAGVFETYDEGGYTYCRLKEASFV